MATPASDEQGSSVQPPGSISSTGSSPVKPSLHNRLQHTSSALPKAMDAQEQMARELKNKWVGPMPVLEFLKTFLPTEVKEENLPPKQAAYFNQLATCKLEDDMYEPFVKLVNTLPFLNGFKFVNTSSSPDRAASKGMKNKPDIGVYKEDVRTKDAPTQYSDLEVIWEFKPKADGSDPFADPPEKGSSNFVFEPIAERRLRCRGQLGIYGRTWFARQHRTHGFMVWLGDPYARLIRLDRDGGIVSARFNYRTEGDLLMQFIYRVCHVDDKTRGRDTTVRLVTDEKQIELVKQKLDQWKPENPGLHPIYELDLPDGKTLRTVFAWTPMFDTYSLIGRATRGYSAWDPISKKVVFVKDAWRPLGLGMEKETDILRTLNSSGVRNVPTLICGDDLDDQFTLTQDYCLSAWNFGGEEGDLSKRAHMRFAEDFVGIPLRQFASSKQFLQTVHDAFIAHKDAYEKCNILHRDISAGNVLLKPGGGGILNDWDLARTVKDIEKGARQNARSGTWQFMSANLCMDPSKMSTLQDDLESFYWLILCFSLRYMASSIPEQQLPGLMTQVFDSHHRDSGGIVGGQTKLNIMQDVGRTPFIGFKVVDNAPLTSFLFNVRMHFDAFYTYLNAFDKKLLLTSSAQGTSFEELKAATPIDIGHLSIKDHTAIEANFTEAMSKTTWPAEDKAFDRLAQARKNLKRPLNSGPSEGSDPKRSRTSQSSSVAEASSSGAQTESSALSDTPRKRGPSRTTNRGGSQSHQRSG